MLQIDLAVASFEHLGGFLIGTHVSYKASRVIPAPLMFLQHLLWSGWVCHSSGK